MFCIRWWLGIVRPNRGKMTSSLPAGFEAFWKAYPRREGKLVAIRAWKKLNPSPMEQLEIISGVERYKVSGLYSSPKFIMLPATFLNGQRWEDELDTPAPPVLQRAPRYCAKCGHTGSWHVNEVKHGRSVNHAFIEEAIA